ncbi:hypothetical protein J5N97_025334 [Dioscorea zingiberensis]|uniref:UAS domain-containing protein n=1 Tax=Dioscorea zingiberensis TaxID=325984 RepID=A0A9D5H9Q8_9LILI|nr:hypothetical protein J5N97_025334 [Dioscorea zingiberensis]
MGQIIAKILSIIGIDLRPKNLPDVHRDRNPSPAPCWIFRNLTKSPFCVTSAVGIGFFVAGGVLACSLSIFDRIPRNPAEEAAGFVASFGRHYAAGAEAKPNFLPVGFSEAKRLAAVHRRLLFAYFHNPKRDPYLTIFCKKCLCSPAVAAYLNGNFVCWGGNIRATDVRNRILPPRSIFPLCIVFQVDANQSLWILRKIEGPLPPQTMLCILQRMVRLHSAAIPDSEYPPDRREIENFLRCFLFFMRSRVSSTLDLLGGFIS